MKKSLFILPIAAMALASCDLSAIMGKITDLIPFWPKGDTTQSSSSSSSSSKSSSSSSKTSSSSSSKTSSSSSSSKTSSSSSSSSQQPGEYTITLNFVTDYEALDGEQYVGADTGLFEDNFGGQLAFTSMGCFVTSYSGSGYVMMRNKDKDGNDWTTGRGGLAFFANTENFGSITRVEITTGTSGANTTYDLTLSKSPITSAQTGGTAVTGKNGQASVGEVTATEADGYGYFAVSTKDKAKNGQIGKLVIEYTIS